MGHRQTRTGTVVSDKMDKTIVVMVERKIQHELYKRTLKQSKKYVAHDEDNAAKLGDLVEIIESKPMSKRKRWRLVKVL
ncbi:MAG: 30S ribosomal protein S17 [Acidobacteria bacterium]|nr:MAG: 30S ribosomal protein S17 [Acidobacteriota bacterium]PIE89989.1 MAG: 30S ribosomal protein S17 [Acidobacteriota bacterium]